MLAESLQLTATPANCRKARAHCRSRIWSDYGLLCLCLLFTVFFGFFFLQMFVWLSSFYMWAVYLLMCFMYLICRVVTLSVYWHICVMHVDKLWFILQTAQFWTRAGQNNFIFACCICMFAAESFPYPLGRRPSLRKTMAAGSLPANWSSAISLFMQLKQA